jgi:hypothetical protein
MAAPIQTNYLESTANPVSNSLSDPTAEKVTAVAAAAIPFQRSFVSHPLYEPCLFSTIAQFEPGGALSFFYHPLVPKRTFRCEGKDLGNLLLAIFDSSKRSLASLTEVTRIFDQVIKHPNFHDIPLDLLEDIFIAACNRGLTPIVEALMKNHRFPEISLEKFHAAFSSAATQGHQYVLRAFISHSRFKDLRTSVLGDALMSIAYYGRIALVKDLIASGRFHEIGPAQPAQALMLTACKGHAAVAAALLSAHPFSKQHLINTKKIAEKNNYPSIAEMLNKMI